MSGSNLHLRLTKANLAGEYILVTSVSITENILVQEYTR